jgi:hypothetical protein
MMTAMTRYARYILLPGVLVAASLPDAQAAKNSLAAERPLTYVVLGERAHALRGETVALLRVVLATSTGNPCVRLSIAGTQGRRLEPIIERRNPDSRRFPITVCEAILPFSNVFSTSGESWRAELDGKTYPLRLPTVVKTPERVLIVGDSGCRDNKRQSCDDEQWPFRTAIPRDMARLIADEGKPTLLLMVGDYNYRQEKKSSSPDRQWRNWLADFFTPMTGGSQDKNRKKTAPSGKDDSIGHLLTMAPLVLARGDHELCAPANEKGGAGWYSCSNRLRRCWVTPMRPFSARPAPTTIASRNRSALPSGWISTTASVCCSPIRRPSPTASAPMRNRRRLWRTYWPERKPTSRRTTAPNAWRGG